MCVGAMRVVKYFSHEESFLKSERLMCYMLTWALNLRTTGIYDMRHNELKGIKKIQIARSAKYVPLMQTHASPLTPSR